MPDTAAVWMEYRRKASWFAFGSSGSEMLAPMPLGFRSRLDR
ncbi:MAG: hypothetical protein ACYC7A_04020 [Thermoanaerobaculia bacterium]